MGNMAPDVPRLTPEEAATVLARAEPIPTGRGARRVKASFGGLDPAGAPTVVHLERATVVVALSTTCDGCRELSSLVAAGVPDFDVVGILRPPRPPVSRSDLAAFTAAGGRWVVGDEAFEVLDAGAPPFFCVIGSDGDVVVEGVTFGRGHLDEHLARVRAGAPRPDAARPTPPPVP